MGGFKEERGAHRAGIALAVYTAATEGNAALEMHGLGAYLAHLMGAILKGEPFEAMPLRHGAFIALLQRVLPWEHPVWAHIALIGTDNEALSFGEQSLVIRKSKDALDCKRASEWVAALASFS